MPGLSRQSSRICRTRARIFIFYDLAIGAPVVRYSDVETLNLTERGTQVNNPNHTPESKQAADQKSGQQQSGSQPGPGQQQSGQQKPGQQQGGGQQGPGQQQSEKKS
jgi:hypothetical protein